MHACEYMTRGIVLLLGSTGANVGAGMTGGTVFIRRSHESQLNREYLLPCRPDGAGTKTLRSLLDRHLEATRSQVAEQLLQLSDNELAEEFLLCRSVASAEATPASTRPVQGATDTDSAKGAGSRPLVG